VAEGTFLVASGHALPGDLPVTVKDGAVYGGGGTAESVNAEVGGTVWPGAGTLLPTSLTVDGPIAIADSLKVCVANLEPGFATDAVVADSATLGNADPAHPFTVHLVSVPFDPPGPAWDPAQSCRWHVVVADTPITQVGAPFVIDASGFTPDVDGGSFSWETSSADGKYYGDVVFTPLAQFDGSPSVGGGTVFAAGGTRPVTWATDSAPPTDSVFKLYAVAPVTSAATLIGTEPASSATSYDFDWAIALAPAAGWRVRVELWSAASGGVKLREADSQSFQLLAASYPITVSAGDHGSVTPASGPVATFSRPTYAIAADPGYAIATVTADGSAVTPAPASYTFTDVREEHAIDATFAPLPDNLPTCTVSGQRSGWSSVPVTLTFTGHPGPYGVAVAGTQYRVGDGAWVDGATVRISAQGTTRVQYRAMDADGIVGPARSLTVRIDSRPPRLEAKGATGKAWGGGARVLYRVTDASPNAGKCRVRLVVLSAAGRVLTRATTNPVPTDRWRRIRLSTGQLGPGTYRVRLRAVDAAGNVQRKATVVWLVVRW
jgi:hypothetical protein